MHEPVRPLRVIVALISNNNQSTRRTGAKNREKRFFAFLNTRDRLCGTTGHRPKTNPCSILVLGMQKCDNCLLAREHGKTNFFRKVFFFFAYVAALAFLPLSYGH